MKKWILPILVVTLAGIYIAFKIVTNNSFRLVKTDPANGSSRVPTTQSIVFYFNQKLADVNTTNIDSGAEFNKIDINPLVPGQVKIDGKKVIFKPGVQGLTANTAYKVTLSNIKAADGRTLKDITINFTAIYVPFNNLSSEQQKQQINETDHYHDTNNARNNFIKGLPYTTSGYSIEYISSGDYFLVRITDTPISTQKTASLKYISAQGVDTSKERVDFFIIKGL